MELSTLPVTHDIVARLWNLCNVLKYDGVTYHQYVTELTFLLFLKMAKETGTEGQLPEGYRWDDLERLEARLAAAQARFEQITPSLLGKAFRGELAETTTDGESNG